MYQTMLDMHREQQAARHEQSETDQAYKAVRSLRLKQTFYQYFFAEVARKKRWRAYRYR